MIAQTAIRNASSSESAAAWALRPVWRRRMRSASLMTGSRADRVVEPAAAGPVALAATGASSEDASGRKGLAASAPRRMLAGNSSSPAGMNTSDWRTVWTCQLPMWAPSEVSTHTGAKISPTDAASSANTATASGTPTSQRISR